ncbi:IS5 family transposase domain protein [Candidatus Cyrtobacter comes]|uniref:IS5 family transposase domain protein n=1 Tax=Candidatus Cyrtobacter comes TaxID=675776 RepID=A0ABU5L985_9RICK|nr:IS5 family transposase domain protein [Candidatus Cyrtobacter comes]
MRSYNTGDFSALSGIHYYLSLGENSRKLYKITCHSVSLERFKIIASIIRRKRFWLRFNLIAGIYNLELMSFDMVGKAS